MHPTVKALLENELKNYNKKLQDSKEALAHAEGQILSLQHQISLAAEQVAENEAVVNALEMELSSDSE